MEVKIQKQGINIPTTNKTFFKATGAPDSKLAALIVSRWPPKASPCSWTSPCAVPQGVGGLSSNCTEEQRPVDSVTALTTCNPHTEPVVMFDLPMCAGE